ncbi:Hypothetical protein D9617_36g063210 [Elsinoe fawcettii]|nr:Hypothetical protein D9617_36g063210 [Elsinoe fawcettii]
MSPSFVSITLSLPDGTTLFSTTGPDGNLYLSESSAASTSSFIASNGMISVDCQGRYLVYFLGEMNDCGLSRIRAVATNQVPKSANLLFVMPLNMPDGSTTLVAVDSAGRTSFFAGCSYAGSDITKLYLYKNVTVGAAALEKKALQTVLTGGVAERCLPLKLQSMELWRE